ncbi:hypothetical protein WME79_47635 [Sorangium sp. So ce726]|uniref:hypothetical protein n=1 Tax=Sorangium sp. So ce726 TaxID=3133319 RepID=UPI003F63008D
MDNPDHLPAKRLSSMNWGQERAGFFRSPTLQELGLADLYPFLSSEVEGSWPDCGEVIELLETLRLRTRYYRKRFITIEQSGLDLSTAAVQIEIMDKSGPTTSCSFLAEEASREEQGRPEKLFEDAGYPATSATELLLACIYEGNVEKAKEAILAGADLYLPCGYKPFMIDAFLPHYSGAIDFSCSPRQAAYVEYCCSLVATSSVSWVCNSKKRVAKARLAMMQLLLDHDQTDVHPDALLTSKLTFDLGHLECLLDGPHWQHQGKQDASTDVRDFMLLLLCWLVGLCTELNEANRRRSCGIEDLWQRLLAIDSLCELCVAILYGQGMTYTIGLPPLKAPLAFSVELITEVFQLQATVADCARELDMRLRRELNIAAAVVPGGREDLWGAAKRNLWNYLLEMQGALQGSDLIWSAIFTPMDPVAHLALLKKPTAVFDGFSQVLENRASDHPGKAEKYRRQLEALREYDELARGIVSQSLKQRGCIDLQTMLTLRRKLPVAVKVEALIAGALGLEQSLQQHIEEALAAVHASMTHPKEFGVAKEIKNKNDPSVCGSRPDVEFYGQGGLAWDAKRLGGNRKEWDVTQRKGFSSASKIPCALLLDATYGNQRRYQRGWAEIFAEIARARLRLFRVVKGVCRPALLEISVTMICKARSPQILIPGDPELNPRCSYGALIVAEWLSTRKLVDNAAIQLKTTTSSHAWLSAALNMICKGELTWYDFFKDHTRELGLTGGRHVCVEIALTAVPFLTSPAPPSEEAGEEIKNLWRIIWVVDAHRFFITFTHYERWSLDHEKQIVQMPAFFEILGVPPLTLDQPPTGQTVATAFGAFAGALK